MYSTDDLKVTVFQPFFIYIDQYLAILPQTIQTIVVTALVMIVIALFLIPSVVCSLWVSFSIVSIEVGVVGFMTLWGISLDGVALINLIMCIGFSVDFSAHICYHYIACEESEVGNRVRASLYALGLPIVQGAVSTILGVFGLAFAPSYLFVTFFKMIFLVILLGAIHGVILLPVLLSLFGPGSCSRSTKKTKSSSKSLESSAISTPTITVFSKQSRRVHDNMNPHGNDDGIHSICSCTINMGYVEDEDKDDNLTSRSKKRLDHMDGTGGGSQFKYASTGGGSGIVMSPSQVIILKTSSDVKIMSPDQMATSRMSSESSKANTSFSTSSPSTSSSSSSPSFEAKSAYHNELHR